MTKCMKQDNSSKKVYSTPVLQVFGGLTTLTQANSQFTETESVGNPSPGSPANCTPFSGSNTVKRCA